ncbi:MAG: hypothetical protein JWQ96_2289 [Segetibacter sp.]|nr:hypothetical protein [Segetibacter sp.]
MLQFSTEDLMQYLYHETSEDQSMAIEKALHANWTLMDKFIVLKNTLRKLDDTLDSPRPEAVSAILHYANTTAVAANL